jgi:hypothetical protein
MRLDRKGKKLVYDPQRVCGKGDPKMNNEAVD